MKKLICLLFVMLASTAVSAQSISCQNGHFYYMTAFKQTENTLWAGLIDRDAIYAKIPVSSIIAASREDKSVINDAVLGAEHWLDTNNIKFVSFNEIKAIQSVPAFLTILKTFESFCETSQSRLNGCVTEVEWLGTKYVGVTCPYNYYHFLS